MAYIKLHYTDITDDEDSVIVNADHIDWITDHFDYTEISFVGGDNTLTVVENASEILQKIADASIGVR